MKDLLKKLVQCKDEEVDQIIQEAIDDGDKNGEKIEKLGFLPCNKSNYLFKGFIPLNTRIKYSNIALEDYGMETTDFMFEFAHFIKDNNIDKTGSLVYNLEYFINRYFGIPEENSTGREDIFNANAWESTTTDEEFFAALEQNKLGDLKNKSVALCTERGAMAQQILSLFGAECYYCMGCVDLGDKQDAHCFNIIKRKNDYAILDYSCTVNSFDQKGNLRMTYPFVGAMSNDEFKEFSQKGVIKNFRNYEFVNGMMVPIKGERLYVLGEYKIDKEAYYEGKKEKNIR